MSAAGRLHRSWRLIDAADDLELTGGLTRSAGGKTLAGAVWSVSQGVVYASVVEAIRSVDATVLIEYTSAVAVKDTVLTALDAGGARGHRVERTDGRRLR